MVWIYFYNWIKGIFQQKTKENVLAITCGDIVFFHILGVPPEASLLAEKMFTTIILAAAGGAAGWAGKELIIWIWKQVKIWVRLMRKKRRLKKVK